MKIEEGRRRRSVSALGWVGVGFQNYFALDRRRRYTYFMMSFLGI